jgi:hypothetical protein
MFGRWKPSRFPSGNQAHDMFDRAAKLGSVIELGGIVLFKCPGAGRSP